jgi:hypothetical protein
MKTILEKHDLKETISLPEFINALDQHEKGYRWKDLTPDGVSAIVWYELHEAYLEDEKENKNGRQAEIDRIERTRVTDIRGHIEF